MYHENYSNFNYLIGQYFDLNNIKLIVNSYIFLKHLEGKKSNTILKHSKI